MYACIYEIRGGFFSGVCTPNDATAHSYDPPPSATQRNRSPTGRTPARRGSHATLPWTALQLRVEVNHYPSGTRAPLAGHPRTALHVVDTSLQASHAGALLVGTCSLGGHAVEVEDLHFAYALYAGHSSNGSSTMPVASFREGRIGYREWATRRSGRINPSVEDRLDHDVDELLA